MIPHEAKFDAITSFNILFSGGDEVRSRMKIKLMVLPFCPNQQIG